MSEAAEKEKSEVDIDTGKDAENKGGAEPAKDEAQAPDAVKGKSTRRTVGSNMTKGQVKLQTNKRFRTMVAATVIFAVLCDILGTAIVIPPLAALCAYADGGPVDTINAEIDAMPGLTDEERAAAKADAIKTNINPYAFKDPKPPVKYSLSMNLVLSFGQCGSALGSLFFGGLCDKIGCKIPMQACLGCGIFGYVMIMIGGKYIESYYLFALGFAWNNFFGNTIGVAQVYFGQMFEGSERDAYISAVLAMALVGASIGALIVMPFVLNPINGENYFNCLWIPIGLTIFSLILVTVVLVPPEIKDNDKVDMATPKLAKRILTITVIASAFDSAGDEGTRMARGTIMSTLFPEWSTVSKQNYLLLAMIGVIMVTIALIDVGRKCGNLGVLAVFGCTATLATQLILMLESLKAVPYIIIWNIGKMFGFMSTFCSSFIIQEVAPKPLLGLWNGRNDAMTNIASAIAPLIFAAVYDGFENPRGQEMLTCTAVISFLALLAYLPLCKLLPKPEKPKKEEEELKDLKFYDDMSPLEYAQLPLEIVDKIQMKKVEVGETPRCVDWGDFTYERSNDLVSSIRERALNDFEYLHNYFIKLLTDREKMKQEQETMKKVHELLPKIDRDQAKLRMGTWMADYFDDAGYVDWEISATIYKAMFMSAFPPIDPIDAIKPDYATVPIEKFEENATLFLEIVDEHLGQEKRRVTQKISVGTFLNTLIRRR